MKKITLKDDATIDLVWPFNAPENAIEVTDDVAKTLLNNRETKAFVDGEIVDFIKPFAFSKAKELKLSEIRNGFINAVSAITNIYTKEEISTFLTQENEALAWQADNAAVTPGIDYIVANRPSVDKATLVSRIITNAKNYKNIVFPAMGKKQAYEDELYALQAQHENAEQPPVSQADIDSIVVDYSV